MDRTSVPCAILAILLWTVFTGRGARGQDIALVYSIDEELPAGTLVGDVAQDSNIRELVGSDQEFRELTYSVLNEGSSMAANFQLQSDTGVLTTATRLDRETLCRYLPECRLSLRLAAQSTLGLFFKIIDVAVVLNDINDNPPVFTPSQVTLIVMEDTDVGELFQLPSALDDDTGANNSVQSYSVTASGAPFRLENSVAGASGLMLRLMGGLDRETVDSYQLLMVATDGGRPVLSGTLTINIQVGDVNDHSPVWDQSQFKVNVSETTAVDTTVVTLAAYDADSGPNGRLTYRFTPLQPGNALGLFALNGTTGQLKVVRSLDNYAGQTYTMEVEARDHGTPFKSARADVIIRVLDTRNSNPEIILSVFGQNNVARLSESSDLGRVVAHISIEDPDSGLNGIVRCSTDSSHFQLQAMDVNQYKVILRVPLDREARDRHNVIVTCRDSGSPSLSATKNFTVQVLDENDEVPVFSRSLYQAQVNETYQRANVRNVYVTTVSASDRDVGDNAKLSYRVIDDPRSEFEVLENGTVLAVRGLDRETGQSQRYIRIIAHDHGDVQNTATATLYVSVLDVNDNPPVFTDPSPLFYVKEGVPVMSYVGNVTAKDADADENAIVLFRMHPMHEGRVPFKVIVDGVIKTTGFLDRESRDRYEFTVLAYDLGKPPLSSTVTVTVRVVDENDNSPAFVFPSDVNNSVTVPHTLSPNTAVATLRAYDVDVGRNRELVYSRDDRNGTRFFDVKPATGEVILIHTLTPKEVGEHVLTVVVHDLGFPTQLANQTLLYIHVYRGNHSALAASGDHTLRNTLLVIVIVAVTVVLSVAVVVTMVMMKRNDRQRRLYRAKEEESKVDANLRQLTGKGFAQGCDLSNSGSDVSAASLEPRRRKEVSFSLDEDNNVTPGSAAMMFETVAADSLEAIPEVTQSQVDGCTELGVVRYRADVRPVTCAKDRDANTSLIGILRSQQRYGTTHDEKQKCLLEPRGQDDNMSDVSCDVSTSDSGRGGSDVEMHSHHGACKESTGDHAFGAHRAPQPHGAESRRPAVLQQRNVTFDLYPTTFSSRAGSGRLTTFPTSRQSDDIASSDPRHAMTSFSSFSPQGRHPHGATSAVTSSAGSRASPSFSSSSTSSSLPPSRRHHPSSLRYSRGSRDLDGRDPFPLPHPYPDSAGHYGEGEDGSYVDLKRQQRRRADGDYMDMSAGSVVGVGGAGGAGDGGARGGSGLNGSDNYVPSSLLSVGGTSGTWDGETTTSGSYTVDPQELTQEIDKLFFDSPKDVVV